MYVVVVNLPKPSYLVKKIHGKTLTNPFCRTKMKISLAHKSTSKNKKLKKRTSRHIFNLIRMTT
jgi:hypothetical protein